MIKDKPTERVIQSINKAPQNKSKNNISKKSSPTERRITSNNRETIYKDKWQMLTLDDAPVEIIDGDRGLNYPKQHDFSSSGYCLFLNAGNVTEEGFNFSDCSFISKERDKVMKKGKLTKGDLVLTTRGTVGNVAIFDNSIQFENIRINSGMVLLRSDNSKLLPHFLYYSLKAQFFRNQMKALITGSAQPQLPIQDIRKIKIYLPPLLEQGLIAHFLGIFEEKIKLNQKMNKTLEAIAQTIFKHWFIDFEFPNEEGKPYKSSGGELVDSELGEIPKGWETGRIKDLAKVKSGKRPIERSEFRNDTFPVEIIGASSIMGYTKDYLFTENLAIIGRVGTHGVVQRTNKPSWPSDNTLVFVTRDLEYIFQILKKVDYSSLNVGSTQPLITQYEMENYKIVVPTRTILEDFERLSNILYKKISTYNAESETLGSLLNLLLPKLMSGKIRVPLEE